jgi:mono/diheme cytochrome c family protein
MVNFERKLPTEGMDAANIVRGILKVQAAFAAAQKRPLGRGTHTKGICARATFEVFDLARKIGDHTLTPRLAHGIYAKPGVYPATVRFANAASTILSDRKPDLRAMSFSVELPPELATNSQYQDFSLQSNPTFPINDAHAFAVVMKVLSAGSGADKLKAIWSLSLIDFFRFAKSALIGAVQTHGKSRAYQLNRYWSTVPFRNGPFEAVKYSAIPSAHNPAHELQDEPNALRDELMRHLEEDTRMSSFDIALQVLDTEHMTNWGMRREASFWVENASVEWKESQAPFHVVGRLTLVAKSAMEIADCEPKYIDVTEHSTPDSEPLGSVNRARMASEHASRKVRLGETKAEEVLEGLPTSPAVPHSRLKGLLQFGAVSLVGLLFAYFAAGLVYRHMAKGNIPANEHVDEVRYLNQGWGLDRESPGRELFYYTPQGAGMHGVRYSWFVNLELPFSKKRMTDPDHMRALNFIVDPAATPANPDHLPVGFARRYDNTIHDSVVDITCAACHTGQLNVTDKTTHKTTAIRIDGGESLSAFTDVAPGTFQMDLGLSIAETLANPFKFNRFAARVLGPERNTVGAKFALWRNMAGVAGELGKVFVGSSAPWHYPVQEGYGRTDALMRIGNVVFGDHISGKNYREGNAPVSYPYLWNIWKFNWVQYDASVSQPMARNVSEAMGVGADFRLMDDYGRPIPKSERYNSSVAFDNLEHIETTLQTLTPPRWPEDLLGKIDQDRANKGKALFELHCVKCHGPHNASRALKDFSSPGRLADDPMWDIRTVDIVGTDPTAANNFYKNTVDLTHTGLTFDEVQPLLKKGLETQKERADKAIPLLKQAIAQQQAVALRTKSADDLTTLNDLNTQLEEIQGSPVTDEAIAQFFGSIDMRAVSEGVGLNILGMMIRDKYYADNHYSPDAQACFAGFDTLDLPAPNDAYKPRPLEGVWATPPFLHNGSVPNLYELLSPREERSKKFFVGRREFDPVKVGYVTEPVEGTKGGFWMKANTRDAKDGDLNIGHEFRGPATTNPSAPRQPGVIGPTLSVDERMAIIEYLKVHRDLPSTENRKPIDCFALLK